MFVVSFQVLFLCVFTASVHPHSRFRLTKAGSKKTLFHFLLAPYFKKERKKKTLHFVPCSKIFFKRIFALFFFNLVAMKTVQRYPCFVFRSCFFFLHRIRERKKYFCRKIELVLSFLLASISSSGHSVGYVSFSVEK